MAWSYRKRIKVIPGVHLNFSKRGISTTIGVKGASINFSKSGTTLNTNVLGFSNRHKLSGTQSRPDPTLLNPELSVNYTHFLRRISSVLISMKLQVKICRALKKPLFWLSDKKKT